MSDTGRPEGETAAPRRSGVGGTLRALLWGTHEDFTSGSLNRGVLLLAIPMVLEMAGESLFFLVDMAVVSRLGAGALAAIALTEAMLSVIYSIAMGLAMATTAMVARRTGEKDERGAARAAVQAIVLSVGIAVVLGLAGAILAPSLLRAMGGSPEVVAAGTTFARIQLGGMVVIILLFVNNAIYRGAGDPSMAMRSVWLANGINIVLDPVLVFGLWIFPELGLPGPPSPRRPDAGSGPRTSCGTCPAASASGCGGTTSGSVSP